MAGWISAASGESLADSSLIHCPSGPTAISITQRGQPLPSQLHGRPRVKTTLVMKPTAHVINSISIFAGWGKRERSRSIPECNCIGQASPRCSTHQENLPREVAIPTALLRKP